MIAWAGSNDTARLRIRTATTSSTARNRPDMKSPPIDTTKQPSEATGFPRPQLVGESAGAARGVLQSANLGR